MKKNCFIAAALILLLTGCQSEEISDNTVKNGTEYTINDNISFYYPDTFELIEATGNKVSFAYEDQSIYYEVIEDDSQNLLDDLDDLYIGMLEQDGAQIISVSKPIIDSGLDCYLITGLYSDVSIRFSELVYFTTENTYVYGYQATSDAYDKNSEVIVNYLETLSIDTGEI